MKHVLKISILLMAILLTLSSCGDGDEPDGKWEKMKWKNIDRLTEVNHTYIIPEEGGTFTFECTNYRPWLSYVAINCEPQDAGQDWQDLWTEFSNDWFGVEIVDKKVIFTFDEIEEPVPLRTVEVVVTGGDIFYTFLFQQQKQGKH